jgi:hypothetical protein
MDEKRSGQERNRGKRKEEGYEENKNEIGYKRRLVRGSTSRKIKVWKTKKELKNKE